MRPLPTTVEAAGLLKQRDPKSPGGCLLGIGRDDASVVECDLLRPHSRFLIAGPDGSGRSNAALLIARQARSSGRRVLVVATGRSPLTGWAAENQITCCLPGELLQDLDADLLVVDDGEHFTDTVTGEELHGWIVQADGAVVVTARMPDLLTSFRGPGAEMRRHRSGLLLQPAAGDGEVLGIRLPHLPPSNLAGRGVLVTAETRGGIAGYEPIQVAA
jgi:S-DNA-T family DNA segregation ATPase FtsK/SpoIIIE